MRIKKLLIGIAVLTMAFQPAFIKADVPAAVAYLQAQPQDPWITQALAASGTANIPVDHLVSVSGALATDYAKAILALAAAGENPAEFGNIDYVAKLKTYYNNNQMGDENLLNDDVWSILALASAGEANASEVAAAKEYLLNNQNSNGGWGYGVGKDSDTNDTAATIMALMEAGVHITDFAIVQAVSYLKSAQNDDGGFGWSIGSMSDSGSDAWVISALYKINQDPISWDKNGHNPITHLQSLEDTTDGGFWWVKPGASEFNNKAMTAYAVIALAGKSYPVAYYQAQGETALDGYHLRIEGQADAICDTYAIGDTALEVVINTAEICGYSYVIEDSSYGQYLSQINNEAAAGMDGWMYFVNFTSPSVGAADYVLSEGDEVLWYYGEWGWQPTRLSVSANNLETGENIMMTVEYFDGQTWIALPGAEIKGGNQNYITDANGQVETVLPDGHYALFALKDGFVRSKQETVTVGQGVSQSVSLVVEIEQGSGTEVAGEAIIFTVAPNQLDFGKMQPGDTANQTLNIINSGTVDLGVAASMSGDSIFTENLQLNNKSCPDYEAALATNENKEIAVSLAVPASYFDSGIKTGELIFWARAK